MGLRKNLNDGSKRYYYANIAKIEYTKNSLKHLTWESNLQVMIVIKDDEDPDFLEQLAPINFVVPHARLKPVMQYGKQSRTDPITGSPVLDKNGAGIIDTIELGPELVRDVDYQDPMDLAKMRTAGVDILSLGYRYLLEQQAFFAGWKNC